jgi:hypothetical protein
VHAGNEMRTDDIDILKSNRVISVDDNIIYFYSQGLFSILESGDILTEDRVISYFTDENQELQIFEIYLSEITDVDLESKGDLLNESVYKVNTVDPERWLKLFLSDEQNGDQKFVEAMRNRLSK